MDFLQQLLDNSQYAFITAFVLGLMTAISPCPLATNISAIGFISRDIENRKKVFMNGVVYTFGRAFSYTTLAVIIFFGASKLNISMLFQGWGEKLLGPALILIGLLLIVGLFEKIGYIGALLLLVMYYLSHPASLNVTYLLPPEGSYLWINKNIVMMFAILVLMAFPSARRIGIDRFIFRNKKA